MSKHLESIQSPADLKKLSIEELSSLSSEIRQRLVDVLSTTGGHLSSNLGTVELTIALHYLFDSPSDKFIFDVSHQAYPHKLLTGRNENFETLRQHKGVCGFTHPGESEHDHFFAGHAGTALSLALGCAKSRDLLGRDEHVIPIIGDAALTCGLTLEALNNIPRDLKKMIVILNDNAMSISKNVGNITNILSRFINHPTSNKIYQEISSFMSKVPGYGDFLQKSGHKIKESVKNLVSTAPFFEQYGLTYVGPIDGHNIEALIETLEQVKNEPRPILLHVLTTKGQGMETAIQNPTSYHGVKPFDKVTGKFHPTSKAPTYPKIFGKHLLEMSDRDPNLVCITPAMPAGSCLQPFMDKHPTRCLDVGIAEGHSVTFAGGIGKDPNLKVVAVIYATFMQRAFDNLFQDVCLQGIPVVFALDRGGLAGPDGSTHNGVYDIGFLNAMPNMVIAQPRNGQLLKELMESAFDWKRPTAIRYPNMSTQEDDKPLRKRALGKGEILNDGEEVCILALGHMCETAMEVNEKLGGHCTVIDPVFVKPLDADLLLDVFSSHKHVITIEEHSVQVGLGSIINHFILSNSLNHLSVMNFGIPETFVEHGSRQKLLEELKLTPEAICTQILQQVNLDENSALSKL